MGIEPMQGRRGHRSPTLAPVLQADDEPQSLVRAANGATVDWRSIGEESTSRICGNSDAGKVVLGPRRAYVRRRRGTGAAKSEATEV